MKEARAVIEAYSRAVRDGVRSALATVVCVEGSAYRRPGARMLMTEDGQMTGNLSGGCLERDVFEHARHVMQTGEPIVVRYDTGADVDIVWGLGLGCNGIVQVLVEPLDNHPMPGHFKLLAECITRQQPGVIATVFGIHPTPPQPSVMPDRGAEIRIGSRLLLLQAGTSPPVIEFAHEELARAVTRDARECLGEHGSTVKAYELAAGRVEIFVEVVEPPVPLIVFGANADAAPVVEFAQQLGWHVTVVDTQARAASRERFARADACVLCRPETVAALVPLTARTVALVMTHNYLHDLELFKTLLPSPARYIGMLGPKRRTEHIIATAAAEGFAPGEASLRRLHAPVGLDLGAETPEEIALSIVAEIRAVLSGHDGGFLKNRDAPIHTAPQPMREHQRARAVDDVEPRVQTLEAISA
ncbi:MAG: XdhC family protein [Pyrinomonadaceae bacterium]|nr:XdhC family protein [Pyrinomonadaceae bacterium]